MALSARLGGASAPPQGHGASAPQRCPAFRTAAVSLAPRILRARGAACLLLHARPARCCAHGAGMPRVLALDAAQPFDREALQKRRLDAERAAADKLLIGIVGFGNFGQFLAKRFVSQGHQVIATSRTDYSAAASAVGVRFFSDADDFVEEQPDVVIISTSILSMEAVLASFPAQRLRRNTLVVDVLSVKVFPKNLFLAKLPASCDILCLHPMFGPESGKGAWTGLPLVYDRVRVGDDPARERRCTNFLNAFEMEGCRMVEMTCEEHDKLAASSQFITHTVGRMLGRMSLPDTEINTRGYESLLSLVRNTTNDSFDLYYGLFMYNENATEELARMEAAFDAVKRQLFDQLHDVVRARIFYAPPEENGGAANGNGSGSAAESEAARGR